MEFAFFPGWMLKYIAPGKVFPRHLNILLSNLLLIIFLYSFYGAFSNNSFLTNVCLVEYIFGVDCPFCGSSRSLGAFFHGDISAAWIYNRAAVILGFYILFQVPLRVYLFLNDNDKSTKPERISKYAGRMILLFFGLNWIVNLLSTN